MLSGCGTKGKSEIDLLFKVVDKEGKGFLTKDDLKKSFEDCEAALDVKVFMTPKDVILPW